MRENIIQVLNVAGTPTACYEVDSVENLSSLYNGQLFRIGQKGLIDYAGNVGSSFDGLEKYRFVIAKNPEEKDMLLRVQPIRCYLRDHQMSSKVIEINPYQSVRWLKNLIEKQRNCSVKLVVNEHQLTEESDSLLKYIYENAIIHVIELRQAQKKISVIYTKEPGPESKVHRIENVQTENKIQQLAKQISRLTSIPLEFLFLIYGGHILPKDRQIFQYHIQANGCIYAVDSRKYMKKVSKQQYQNRLAQVKKVKQNNKAVVQKVKQQNERKRRQKPIQKPGKSREMYQKSRQVMGDIGEDDTEYFRNPQMNIDSEETKQFDRKGKELQEINDNKGYPMRVDTSHRTPADLGIGTPPNSPIFLFNRQQSYHSTNNELKQGRIITKDTDVYQDKLGFTHEHDKEKTVFKSGKTKIVEIDIAKDPEGNVIKIQHDFVKVKRDPQTGHVTKTQTDIIEDSQHGKTIIKRQQVRDKDGNVIKSETDIIKSESGQKSNKKQQRDTITEGDKVTSYNTQVLQNAEGIPVKIQTDMTQRKEDELGNSHEYSKDVKQQDGVTTVIERNVVRDKQGNIIQLKTDVIKITEDQQGNIYKHQRNQIDKQNKKVIIQRDIVSDRHGNIISKQTDMKMVEEGSDSNIHKHETDIIEGVDGRTIVIQKNIIQDSDGNVIKSQTDMFQLNKGEKRQLQQMEIEHGRPEAIRVQNQKQPMINGGTEVTIDELGNTHTREKQLVEKEGKTTFVDRDTVQDPRGKIIRVETDIVQIEGDDQGNMRKHKSEIIQSEGKVVMVQTDIVMDPDGVTIRKQKDTIEIDQSEDGSVIKREKDVIQQDGRTRIIEKDIVEDPDGNVIRSETKVTEIEEDQDTVNVHEKQEVVEAVEDDGTLVEGDSSLRKQVQVIQDQQGNTLTRQKQLIEDEQGKTTVVYRNIVQNAQGDILKQQTQMMHISDQNGSPELHRHAIDYSESSSGVKIQETTSRQNFDGSIIRSQKETIQIQEQEDGTVKRKQMDIIQQNGRKTVHVKNMLQDQTGRLISKTSDIIELQSIQYGTPNLALQVGGRGLQRNQVERSNFQRTYNLDEQGNFHILETEIKNNEGQQVMVERQFISNQKGELIKTQTGILQIQEGRNGSTRLTATDIVQQGNIVTITQNDSIQDSEGNSIRAESGIMQIQDIGSGVTRKQKQNIIQAPGVRVKVEKQTFHDEQGYILQEKVRTTQLTDQYDQDSGVVVSEGYKRKEKQMVGDEEGNMIWREKEVVDRQQGQTTIVETEVIRDEEGKLVQATTDVVEMTEQQDGTVHRYETNIIEKPGKMTIAESKTVENAEGERLQGEVESIVVTKGENGEIIKKETGIIMQNLQKTIVERVIVEDAQGNIIKAETRKKRIYTDENGIEQARDVETYQVNQEEIQGQPSTFEKQIVEDAQGNKRTIERETIEEDGQTKVVQTTTIQNADGSLARLETGVLEIRKSESGTELVKQTNIIEDEKRLRVMQNSSLSNREGDVLISKTQIVELVEGQDGNTKKTVTNVLEQAGQTTITEKKAIQTEDGDVISQSMNVTKIIQHQDGSVEVIQNSQPYQLEQQRQGQYTEVDSIIRDPVEVELAPVKEKQILEDMEGNVHTLEKQVIINEDGTTVIKSETIENSSGKVIIINTNIVDTKQLEDGKTLRHQTEIVSGQKLTTTEIYTIQNADGSIHSQKTRKVQIEEDDGLIKTSKIDVVRKDGQTVVTGSQMLEDEDGNIIDQSNNQLNISQSQQAVREQAKKIAKAQIQGEITGIVTEYHEDEDGNRHIVERETIEHDGKKIRVDHSTVKNEDGEVVIVQTNIVTQTQRGDGKIERSETQITEQGGKTRVVQYSEIKEENQALQQLQSSAKSGNLSDLLGFGQEEPTPQEPGTIKYTTFDLGGSEGDLLLESVKEPIVIGTTARKVHEVNLLDDSLTNSEQRIGDLPLESRKELKQTDFNKKYREKSEEEKQLPEEYDITVINKQRVETAMRIRYDEIIDELAEKLGNTIGKSKESIKFYKDGNELQQYELVSDLDILPGTELYYFVEEEQEEQ